MPRRKNIYKLEDLEPKIILDVETRNKLFEYSEIFLKLDYLRMEYPWQTIAEYSDITEYYVLFDLVIYKGNSKYFRGESARVDRDTLSKFIKKILENNENRPLRILPVNQDYQFLIYIDDSGGSYLYQNNII